MLITMFFLKVAE